MSHVAERECTERRRRVLAPLATVPAEPAEAALLNLCLSVPVQRLSGMNLRQREREASARRVRQSSGGGERSRPEARRTVDQW